MSFLTTQLSRVLRRWNYLSTLHRVPRVGAKIAILGSGMRTAGDGIYDMAPNIASLEMKGTTIRPRITSGTPFIF
jgi:hypothetical protein